MRSLDVFHDYFFGGPALARAAVAGKPPLILALSGFLAGSFGLALWTALGFSQDSSLIFLGAALFLLSVFFSFARAAIVHLAASLLSGDSGGAAALFAHFGLADFSWALAAPAAILLRLGRGSVLPAVFCFLILGFFNWSLKARGIRLNYGFGGLKSWALFFFPILLNAVLVLAFILLLLSR